MAQPTNILKGVIGSCEAADDLATKNRFVKFDSSGELDYCGSGDKAVGILLDPIDDGEMGNFAGPGNIVRLVLGGTVTYMDEITADANGAGIKKIASQTIVHKAVDEAKASDTTYADDEVLANIPVAAGQKYLLRAKLNVSNAKEGAASIKAKFTVPASCTAVGSILGRAAVDGTVTKSDDDAVLTTEFTHEISASETGIIEIEGIVNNTAGAAGVIALQWAQNASDAGAITVHAESFIEITDLSPQAINGVAMSAGDSGDVIACLLK